MSGLHDPPLGESGTRSKLIDPAIHARDWTEEHIRWEETAGAIEITDGKPRRRGQFGAGTDGLESPGIFNTPQVRKAGGKDGPIKALRELGKPADILLDTKARLFAA